MRRLLVLFAMTFVGLAIAVPVSGASPTSPGSPDKSFGNGGRVFSGGTIVSAQTSIVDMISLGDGSTVSLERSRFSSRSGLVKRDKYGMPDPSFGVEGSALLPTVDGGSYSSDQVVKRADSLFVTSLAIGIHKHRIAIQKLNSSAGDLDAFFGRDGTAAFSSRDLFVDTNAALILIGLVTDDRGRVYIGARPTSSATSLLFRLEPNGRLDPSFGTKGVLQIPPGPCRWNYRKLIATQAGIILYSWDCARQYSFAGRLDYAKEFPNLEGNLNSLVLAPSGEVFAEIGESFGPTQRILKLDQDGSIVPAFGADGSLPEFAAAPEIVVRGLSVDSLGRLVLGGRPFLERKPEERPEDIRQAVIRVNQDGTPDQSFGDGGISIFVPPSSRHWSQILKVVPLPDGIALVSTDDYHSYTSVRLTADGAVDTNYGSEGLLTTFAAFPTVEVIRDTLTLKNGTLAGGRSGNKPMFVRHTPNGRVDLTFGNNGRVLLPISPGDTGTVTNLGLADDGYLACITSENGVSVVKIDFDGMLVKGFGRDGVARIDASRCAGIAEVRGGILVAGRRSLKAAVVRLDEHGSLDRSYGENGYTSDLPQEWSFLKWDSAFAALPDGRSLVADPHRITRLRPNGTPDRSFGRDGSLRLPAGPKGNPIESATAIGVSRGGLIFVLGYGGGRPVIFSVGHRSRSKSLKARRVAILKNRGFAVRPTDIKLQKNGRIVISATARRLGCFYICETVRAYRVMPSGQLDRSFGRSGVFVAGFKARASANSVSLSRRGITLGGSVETSRGLDDGFLMRLNP